MSTATTTETALSDSLASKFRKTVIGAGFTMVLIVPKVLNLRRTEHSWAIFLTVLGVFGAALVILPIGFYSSYFLAVIGLGIFTAAILLPPAKVTSGTDDKARELGALVVVNGGRLQSGIVSACPVQLFVGFENIWALNDDLVPQLVISVPEILSARAEEVHNGWILRVRWADHSVIFTYSGMFADHLSRVAESTVQSVMRPSLPVLPQRRAASA